MLDSDISTNEQDYTFLFRSYWKNGTSSHLVNLLKEMNFFGLNPTESMINITRDACKAAKDSNAEKELGSISTKLSANSGLSHKENLEKDLNRIIQKIDLTREILEKETPPGNFIYAMFGSHKLSA